ncbi:hypothetical protein B0H13DRAFT_2313611 [Mycena leptocephala]|nr:hypothetical protein B0H13DRAFT_2313611 [Mycena leptocephala]
MAAVVAPAGLLLPPESFVTLKIKCTEVAEFQSSEWTYKLKERKVVVPTCPTFLDADPLASCAYASKRTPLIHPEYEPQDIQSNHTSPARLPPDSRHTARRLRINTLHPYQYITGRRDISIAFSLHAAIPLAPHLSPAAGSASLTPPARRVLAQD